MTKSQENVTIFVPGFILVCIAGVIWFGWAAVAMAVGMFLMAVAIKAEKDGV